MHSQDCNHVKFELAPSRQMVAYVTALVAVYSHDFMEDEDKLQTQAPWWKHSDSPFWLSAFPLFSIEATVPFHSQAEVVFFRTFIWQNQRLIFIHSNREPNIATAVAFDRERVLETPSLVLAYNKIKCISFVSLIVGSSRLLLFNISTTTHAKRMHT